MKGNVCILVRITNLIRMEFVKDANILIKNAQNATKMVAKIVKKDFIQKTTPVNNVLKFLRIVHFVVLLNALLVKKERSYRKMAALKTVQKINYLKKESANFVMKHFQIVKNALSWSAHSVAKIISYLKENVCNFVPKTLYRLIKDVSYLNLQLNLILRI